MPIPIALRPKSAVLNQADWTILQRGHDEASRILGRSARKHEHADRLAREVFRLFDRGHRDPNIIAAIAAQSETKIVLENITEIKVNAVTIKQLQGFVSTAI